jgi:hypothetical protein
MTKPHLAVADANPAAPAQVRNTARRLALGAVAGPALFTLACSCWASSAPAIPCSAP